MADYNWSNNTWPHPYDSDNGAWDTVSERRVALDGYSYTAEEFQQHYGPSWEQIWTNRVSTVLPRRRARSSTRSRSPSASRDQPTTAATPPADDSELAADGGNVSQVAADGGNVSQLAANLHTLAPVNDHTSSSTGSRAGSTPLTDRPKGRLSVILERNDEDIYPRHPDHVNMHELRYCADFPNNGPIDCAQLAAFMDEVGHSDKNVRNVWFQLEVAGESYDILEGGPFDEA